MENCPVSKLPIVEKSHWKTEHPDQRYTTRIKKIGNDIFLTYYETETSISIEHRDQSLFRMILEECGLEDNLVYLMRDLSHVNNISYAYKIILTQLIYRWPPYYKLIVFYNIDPEFLTTVETFASIVPESTPVLLVDSYEEAITTILSAKAGNLLQKEYDEEEDALYAQRKKEFLAATARIGWMNMHNQPITLPDEDELLYPFFKALECLQEDLQAKEKLSADEKKIAENKTEKKLSEKIILLNAQLELNNQLKSQFDREKAALRSRIAAQDMEITRVSTAVAEKTAALQSLREKIFGLDIDKELKKEMIESCSQMIETETIEKKINTDLTATDSEFLSKLQRQHPNLNQRDLRICLLIKLNYDTREIARSIGISTRGLESIRYRMHKKMGLSKHQSIKNYLTKLAVS
ncbi:MULTISPECIES: helix-turn-helix transcriptional regulator [Prosthecochloris]|uniref:Transcriptional regulator n=1 Tax=Prosthecochloris marina TaxID=2017681 RepID=A0A317T7K7_9CHLB|nr:MULTISPECIES: transcriptional regulator [Prosthecochloris]PWW82654.1 transcriptional regulator [Prosthecochloris marina]UZJ38064.1 transcriptional regulator [Prosthecochloris sp. SCSIO W1103]UZJ41864.1 transcriptional regulator [Prosthecochloris sp. SCSIO W1101]